MFPIRELAQQTGLTTSAIRYYESAGLIPKAARSENGYRAYTATDVERLTFIKNARRLGFSISEIGAILELRNQRQPPCEFVIEHIQQQISTIDAQILQLNHQLDELKGLLASAAQLEPDLEMQACICGQIRERTAIIHPTLEFKNAPQHRPVLF